MNDSIFSIEHNLVSVLTRMELAGVEIDLDKLLNVERELKVLSTKKNNLIQSYTTKPLNINSNKQLSEFLFAELKLEPP